VEIIDYIVAVMELDIIL